MIEPQTCFKWTCPHCGKVELTDNKMLPSGWTKISVGSENTVTCGANCSMEFIRNCYTTVDGVPLMGEPGIKILSVRSTEKP